MQENWIGKSRGLQFRFRLAEPADGIDSVEVFTTRPDTIFGASFVAIAADHPIAQALAAARSGRRRLHRRVQGGRHQRRRNRNRREEGLPYRLRGRPPARSRVAAAGLHRELRADGLRHGRLLRRSWPRSARFRICEAISFADSPRCCSDGAIWRAEPIGDEAETAPGIAVNSRFLDGLASEQAAAEVIRRAETAGWGHGTVQYRLRDWGVSRQRYWGTPIPIIHCATCGAVPVPRDQLPVVLPEDVSFDVPGNPLDRHPTWKHVACPSCGGARDARDRHARHLRRFELVFHPLRQPARATSRSIAPKPRHGCRSRNISAGSSMRSCTCSMRASGPGRCSGSGRSRSRSRSGPVHARDGHPRDLPRRATAAG